MTYLEHQMEHRFAEFNRKEGEGDQEEGGLIRAVLARTVGMFDMSCHKEHLLWEW